MDRWLAWLAECDFDAARYIRDYPDLIQGGVSPATAAEHFARHGCQEGRIAGFAPFPTGLANAPRQHQDRDVDATALFRSVFDCQIRGFPGDKTMWPSPSPAVADAIRHHRGLPYFAVGDSHARHFVHHAPYAESWPAGMPVVMHGATAAGLFADGSPSAAGLALLRWCQKAMAIAKGELDVPIFLVFGGLDTEFRWIYQRLRDGVTEYTVENFDKHTNVALEHYRAFLTMLAGIAGPHRLHVCSAFPSTREKPVWNETFVSVHAKSPSDADAMRHALARMEIPDRPTRTALRLRFNARLASVCADLKLRYVECCQPFLNQNGDIDPTLVDASPGGDFHLKHEATAPILSGMIAATIGG